MPFERFEYKGGNKETPFPGVSIHPKGWLYLNAQACRHFAMPENAFVFFHFNAETNEVALEIIGKPDTGAYAIPSRPVIGRTCKPVSFLKYWGIEPSQKATYALREVEAEGRRLLVFGPVERTGRTEGD